MRKFSALCLGTLFLVSCGNTVIPDSSHPQSVPQSQSQSQPQPQSQSKAAVFTIVGTWGMVSGTITNSDGTTNRYDALSDGKFYQVIQYKIDGTYIKTTSAGVSYGTYSYNDSNHSLKYKLDSDQYYAPAIVTVHSPYEMTIFTDWGSVGSMTQYFRWIR